MQSRYTNADAVVTPRTESARALRTPRSRYANRTPGADSLSEETHTVKAFSFDLPARAPRLSDSAQRRRESPSWRERSSGTFTPRASAYRDEARESREQAQRFRLVRGLLEAQEDGARFCLLLEQLLSYRDLSRREFEARLLLLPREEADRLRAARATESQHRQAREREVWDVEEIVRRANRAKEREAEAKAALEKANQAAAAAAAAATPSEAERRSGRHESAHRRYPRQVNDTPPEVPRPTNISPPPRPTNHHAQSPQDRGGLVDSTPNRVAYRRLSDSSSGYTEAAGVSLEDNNAGRLQHHQKPQQQRANTQMVDAAPLWSEVMALQEAVARLQVRMLRLEDGDVLSALTSLRRHVNELEQQTEAIEKIRGITW